VVLSCSQAGKEREKQLDAARARIEALGAQLADKEAELALHLRAARLAADDAESDKDALRTTVRELQESLEKTQSEYSDLVEDLKADLQDRARADAQRKELERQQVLDAVENKKAKKKSFWS
jgi:chromosome segregation ATPase